MSEQASNFHARLDDVVDDFADLDARERLELLLEFADDLPPLPARLESRRAAGENRVNECQTPVYMWVEIDGGQVQVFADVAPEAPTVKGFVAILVDAFSGSSPSEAASFPGDFLDRLGLAEALGMTRLRGMSAILNRIRREISVRNA